MTINPIEMSRCDFAEAMCMLNGEMFSMREVPMFYDIMECNDQDVLLKCGRQVAKSTTMCARNIANSACIPHFKTLYISPTQNQTKVYSRSRLQKMIDHSPLAAQLLVGHGLPMDIFTKHFRNGSEINLGYAKDDPDRIRSQSADEIDFDEIQDMLCHIVFPPIIETNARSKYKWVWKAGTPKSAEAFIETDWKRSTQDEWIMRCLKCSKWNFIDSVRSLGKTGPICVSCGGPLNVRGGRWHSMNHNPNMVLQTRGFHIPQVILPIHFEPQPDEQIRNGQPSLQWMNILKKLDTYDDVSFLNEVLGVSVSTGARTITLAALEAQCRDYDFPLVPDAWHTNGVIRGQDDVMSIYAGVDWSGGGYSSASYTSLWIIGALPNACYKLLYYRIFQGKDPLQHVREVVKECRRFNVKKIGADAGVGALANSMLREVFGSDRVIQFQYGGGTKHDCMYHNDRYHINRTAMIDSFMLQVLRGQIFFAKKEIMMPAFHHILNPFEETTRAGTRIWQTPEGQPDDALHSGVFAKVTAELDLGRLAPYATPTQQELYSMDD
jgi:hypothetical protein